MKRCEKEEEEEEILQKAWLYEGYVPQQPTPPWRGRQPVYPEGARPSSSTHTPPPPTPAQGLKRKDHQWIIRSPCGLLLLWDISRLCNSKVNQNCQLTKH